MLWLTMRRLKSNDSSVRTRAIEELANTRKPEFVELILNGLNDPSYLVRRIAVIALTAFHDPRIAPALLKMLDDQDDKVRRSVAQYLHQQATITATPQQRAEIAILTGNYEEAASLGAIAVSQLLDVVRVGYRDHAGHGSAQLAEHALFKITDPKAAQSLIEALRDEKADVRQAAAKTLGYVRPAEAVGSLIVCLRDGDIHVRNAAAEALGKIGDRRAVQPLIEVLMRAVEGIMAHAIFRALEQLQDARAIKPLAEIVARDPGGYGKLAKEILEKLGSPLDLVEPLIAQLKATNSNARFDAVVGLREIGDKRCIGPLLEVLSSDEDPVVRMATLTSLAEIGDGQTVGALLPTALKATRDKKAASSAVEALEKMLLRHSEAISSNDLEIISNLDGNPNTFGISERWRS